MAGTPALGANLTMPFVHMPNIKLIDVQGRLKCVRYVQMLERQQTQLIAGLQALYQMMQQGQQLTGGPLHTNDNGRPLVHKILERLGVLDVVDAWDEIEAPEAEDCKRESTSPEPETPASASFPHEAQCLWPNDPTSQDPVGIFAAATPTWDLSTFGNATLPPWPTAACQFLAAEPSQSQQVQQLIGPGVFYGECL
ncbi:MAG: hypothetical protein Q9181_003661 [Wetmoreana brouardii]